MKAHTESVEVQLHSFVTSLLDGSEYLPSRANLSTLWMGPRACMDNLYKTKVFCSYRDSNPEEYSRYHERLGYPVS